MGNKCNTRNKMMKRRSQLRKQIRNYWSRKRLDAVSSKIGENHLCDVPPGCGQIRLRQDLFIQPQLVPARAASTCSIKSNENTEQIEGDDTIVLKIEKDTDEDQFQCPQDSVPDESNVTPESKPMILPRLRARPEKKPPVSLPTTKEITKEQVRQAKENKKGIQRRRREAAADGKMSRSARTALLTDECQVYGNSLAITLRRYPKRTRNLLKKQISNLIMFADSGYDQLAKYGLLSSLQRASPIIYKTEGIADDDLNLTEVSSKTDLTLFHNKSQPVLQNYAALRAKSPD